MERILCVKHLGGKKKYYLQYRLLWLFWITIDRPIDDAVYLHYWLYHYGSVPFKMKFLKK